MKKILFRENGFIVSYTKYNFELIIYILLRGLQFFFDILLPNIFMIIMWRVYGFNILMSTLWGLISFLGFQILGILMFKTKTIGMAIAKLSLIDKNGIFATRSTLFYRSLLNAIYVLPIIGWFLLVPNILSIFFTKGLTPLDLLTKSQILPNHKAFYFNKIMTSIERGENEI